jgi:pimeloyl-ACP methyl ester carboxylesterase
MYLAALYHSYLSFLSIHMASSKTTIVIAPGLCHTPELYVGLRDKLEAKGFPTASAVPPSIFAEDASTIVVDTDTKFYQDHVIKPLLDEGKDVIVVGHSYGGAFGAAAVQGLSKSERAQTGAQGGVVGFIYAASFCVWPGESAVDALALDPSNLPAWVGPGVSFGADIMLGLY